MAVHIGEAVVPSLEEVSELLVVDSELVKNGGVEIVHVDGVLGDVVAEVVRAAVGHAGFDSAASHPEGEAARVVITAVVVAGQLALAVGSSSKFSSPDHKCVVEHTSLFEVFDQGR